MIDEKDKIIVDGVDVSGCYDYQKATGICRTGFRVDEIPYCECFTCNYKRWQKAEQQLQDTKMKIKNDTHLVIKRDLIYKKLDPNERKIFENLVKKITQGVNHEYLVCNKDEPYACKVLETILQGELDKQKVKEILEG